jgi:hypothetical protein
MCPSLLGYLVLVSIAALLLRLAIPPRLYQCLKLPDHPPNFSATGNLIDLLKRWQVTFDTC